MPKRENTIPGAPCWMDLMTSDPTKGRCVLRRAVRLDVEEGGDEFGGYITFSKDGGPIVGAMRNDGRRWTRWVVHLSAVGRRQGDGRRGRGRGQ